MVTMRRIGKSLVKESKAAAAASADGGLRKKDWTRRDLLSLLVKANTAMDLPPNQQLNDDEVLVRKLFHPSFVPSDLHIPCRNSYVCECQVNLSCILIDLVRLPVYDRPRNNKYRADMGAVLPIQGPEGSSLSASGVKRFPSRRTHNGGYQ